MTESSNRVICRKMQLYASLGKMAKAVDHIERARLNAEFAEKVLSGMDHKFSYWAIVAFFYSALQWVDAYLDEKVPTSYHPRSHGDRESSMGKLPDLKSIYTEYRFLRCDSDDARYRCRKFNKAEIKQARVNLDRVRKHLESKLAI